MKQSTVYIVHAAEDRALFLALAEFLESGANVRVFAGDGTIGPGETVVSKAAEGLSADILLILLSPASSPKAWVRAEWEPVFQKEAVELGVEIGAVLLGDCEYPKLLQRGKNFFDLRTDALGGFRRIKRWIRGLRLPLNAPYFQPAPRTLRGRPVQEIEEIRRKLSDRPGVASLRTGLALEFAHQCHADFDDVFWIFCGSRSDAQIVGDLGAQIGLSLEGQAPDNAREIHRVLADQRCLLIVGGADERRGSEIHPGGRCSTLRTQDIEEDGDPPSARARELLDGMCSCAPGGFRIELAARIAQIPLDEALTLAAALNDGGFVLPLDDVRLYVPEPVRARFGSTEKRDRHASAVATSSDLAELLAAVEWALSSSHPSAWADACTAGWNAFAILDVTGRHAEAFELLGAMADNAGPRGDTGILDRCLRRQAWILERWGRDAEAAQLARQRRSLSADQMLLPFPTS